MCIMLRSIGGDSGRPSVQDVKEIKFTLCIVKEYDIS
jgi:hypothetical protein